VAVVGARKVDDYMWLRNLSTFTGGPVYSVNIDPNELPGIEALGFTNYARLTDIPEPVDFVVVAVPRRAAPLVLRDAIAKGVAGVSMFTAGFAETAEEEGLQLQQTITTLAPIRPQDVILHDLATLVLDLAALERDYRRPAEHGRDLAVSVVANPSRLRDLLSLRP